MTRRIALGGVFLATGVLWLLSTTGVVDLSYRTWIGVLLVAIGLAIALTPRRHGILVLLGVLVALAGLPALLVDGDVVGGGVGDRIEAPASPVELETYRHGIGKLTLDLTAPTLAIADVAVTASVGIGELVVTVPTEADVVVDAHAGTGSIQAFGASESGFDVELDLDLDRGGEGTAARRIDLDLEVGIGSIRVERSD